MREDWWFLGFGPRTIGDIPPAENHERHPFAGAGIHLHLFIADQLFCEGRAALRVNLL